MRLGVKLDIKNADPDEMARAYVVAGYSAAVCPPLSLDEPDRIRAVREAFARHDVVIAEVGVWNNMLDPNPTRRAANVAANARALALAEEVGALCCVNIAGSFHSTHWGGPHPQNLSQEAFDLTVQNIRQIVDAVKPRRARYTLEPMPWVIPDSPDSYLRLIEVIDRPAFGVHLDPVNLINCPLRYYDNAGFLRECFSKLGPWIVSCHGKDIILREQLTVHLDEVRPGLGALDYSAFLQELDRLPGDVPLLLEHLPQEEYPAARNYVVGVAARIGLTFHSPKAGL
ncbi:MAG: sugar phosphate isomerase/epimerase [Anaerolineae bacterium]|nr:MAG: sugar phosphate isomerase/epimerase [Anaerolineae bacterium]